MKTLGRGLVVEALREPDGIVEAIRWRGAELRARRAVAPGVHARPGIGDEHLDGAPILDEFLDAVRARKSQRRDRDADDDADDHQSRHRRADRRASPPTTPRAVAAKYAARARRAAGVGGDAAAPSASPRSRRFRELVVARTDDARATR